MKKILVVVDMQNDFIDGALGTPEARGIVDNVCRKIREGKWDLIFTTYDTHEELFSDYLKTQEGKKLPIKHCVLNSYGWKINESVKRELTDTITFVSTVVKNSFGSIDLPGKINHFNQHGTDADLEITLVGVCTDICVVTNALLLKTYFPEARIVVDASCCAGSTPLKHDEALDVMRSCQIDIVGDW